MPASLTKLKSFDSFSSEKNNTDWETDGVEGFSAKELQSWNRVLYKIKDERSHYSAVVTVI